MRLCSSTGLQLWGKELALLLHPWLVIVQGGAMKEAEAAPVERGPAGPPEGPGEASGKGSSGSLAARRCEAHVCSRNGIDAYSPFRLYLV